MTIHLAAVGDLHVGTDSLGQLAPTLAGVNDEANALLLAGDLTRNGSSDEARTLALELADVQIPTVAVLGNHDYHLDEQDQITDLQWAACCAVE